ncbi:MAG: hypothetical protein II781_02325 [Clostridia bacterium]|nr:hypothetical protein [Clostridia bacterium]
MRTKQLIDRWKNEYDFQTFLGAGFSLAVTVIYAIYKVFLGAYHASLWYGSICAYYLALILLRGSIVFSGKRMYVRNSPDEIRNRVYFTVSFLLMLLNISLVVPISLLAKQLNPVRLTIVPAIAMAAYTTYKMVMASLHLKKQKESSDNLVHLLRTIHFMDALVSILTLQNTLIMVQSGGKDMKLLPLTAATGAAVWTVILVLILSVREIAKGIRLQKGKG